MKNLILLLALTTLVSCKGKDGSMGPKGDTGAPGSSCSVTQVSNGAIISCENGTSAVLLNGQDGADGSPAPATPYTVTEIIDPCGNSPGFDEVLLRLHNGQIMAHYAQGALQFLTILSPGTYRVTDGTNCVFTVHPDMSVTW
jgi:hypothetical protein